MASYLNYNFPFNFTTTVVLTRLLIIQVSLTFSNCNLRFTEKNLVLFTLTERNMPKKKRKMKILIPSTVTSELVNYQKATRALEDNFSPPAQCLIVWR